MEEKSPLERLMFGQPYVPPIKPDTPLYESVGRFVTSFANAETSVHILARKLSGLPDAKARIIFGGMRLADLTDVVNAMARTDKLPDFQLKEIEDCLSHLNQIGKRRHSLVHRSSNFLNGKIVVSNILTSKVITSSETEAFEVGLLGDMQIDLGRISLRLRYVADPALFNEREVIDALLHMRAQPWLYKPTPPLTPNLKPRDKSAKPPRQPRASSASRRKEAMERKARKPEK